MRCLTEMGAGDLAAVGASIDELLEVADAEGSWLYRSDALRWRIATILAACDFDGARRAIEDLEGAGSSALVGRAFVSTQRMFLDWFTRNHDGCLQFLDFMWASLPVGDPCGTDRRLVELIRLSNLIEMGRWEEAAAEYEAIEPHRSLDRAACRRYPAELALTAGLVADLGLVDLAPPIQARLEAFRGQIIVMSWGECLIGSADGYIAQLASLRAGRPDAEAFEQAISLEERLGDHLGARRTRERWERLADRIGSDLRG